MIILHYILTHSYLYYATLQNKTKSWSFIHSLASNGHISAVSSNRVTTIQHVHKHYSTKVFTHLVPSSWSSAHALRHATAAGSSLYLSHDWVSHDHVSDIYTASFGSDNIFFPQHHLDADDAYTPAWLVFFCHQYQGHCWRNTGTSSYATMQLRYILRIKQA